MFAACALHPAISCPLPCCWFPLVRKQEALNSPTTVLINGKCVCMCVFVWGFSSVLMDDSSYMFVRACSQSSGSRVYNLRYSFYIYRKTLMSASDVVPHKTSRPTNDFNPCGWVELSRCDVLTSASDPGADIRTSLRAHQFAACKET